MDFTELRHLAEQIETECGKAIIGKGEQIRLVLTSLFAGGHVLIDDIPGVGKTTLVKALSAVLGCGMVRVQFTPDLLPSDIVGMNIYSQKTGEMVFTPGPIMTNILLADEINRAIPRTQSALLEAMEEGQITVDGVTRAIPDPFLVIATQNPVGASGTQLLPDSQLDRFAIRLSIGYPSARDELELLRRKQRGNPLDDVCQIIDHRQLAQLRGQADSVYVDDDLLGYIVRLVQTTREHPQLLQGASPRAAIAVTALSRATAFLRGRDFVIPEDVQYIWTDAIAHRLILPTGTAGSSELTRSIAEDVLRSVRPPRIGKRL